MSTTSLMALMPSRSPSRDQIGEIKDCAIFKHRSRNCWMFVLPDLDSPTRWRSQHFTECGFTGHSLHNSKDDAVDSVLSMGFDVRDDGALDRVQSLPSFARGNFVNELISNVNQDRLSLAEADVLLMQYDKRQSQVQAVNEVGGR